MKINGLKWDVEILQPDDEQLNGDSTYMGLCVFLEQKIYLRGGMSKKLTERTFLHELVHAFIFSYGINEDMDEEGICNFISAHFDGFQKIIQEVKDGHIY